MCFQGKNNTICMEYVYIWVVLLGIEVAQHEWGRTFEDRSSIDQWMESTQY